MAYMECLGILVGSVRLASRRVAASALAEMPPGPPPSAQAQPSGRSSGSCQVPGGRSCWFKHGEFHRCESHGKSVSTLFIVS